MTTDELDAILESELAQPGRRDLFPGGVDDIDEIDDIEEALLQLRNWSDCRRITPARSHRRGFGARVARASKRLFGLLFRPFIHTTLETQSRFNERVVVAIELLLLEHRNERDSLLREIRDLREAVARRGEDGRTEARR